MATPLTRAVYRTGIAARIGFYGAHYAALRRFYGEADGRRDAPATRKALSKAMSDLFADDWANIEAGLYPLPPDMRRPPRPRRLLKKSRDFFKDVRAVSKRREAHGHSDVMTPGLKETYPRYYLQNFHYQTDGWLSEDSAGRYDTQVEVLFTGAADAMRRQALPFIAEALKGKDPREARLLDLATGTGRFPAFVKDAFPALPVSVLDMSPDYLNAARKALKGKRDVDFIRADAADTGLADASFDIITSVFLFHELPPKVRGRVAAEIARLLKPGGVFILLDTLQLGDNPPLDRLLSAFPRTFHEPYYVGYIAEDLAERFGDAGLELQKEKTAFLSKASCFMKTA